MPVPSSEVDGPDVMALAEAFTPNAEKLELVMDKTPAFLFVRVASCSIRVRSFGRVRMGGAFESPDAPDTKSNSSAAFRRRATFRSILLELVSTNQNLGFFHFC